MTTGRALPFAIAVTVIQAGVTATGLSPDLLIVLKYFGMGLGILVSLGIFGMAWRANNAAIKAFASIQGAVDLMGQRLDAGTSAATAFHGEQIQINKEQNKTNEYLRDLVAKMDTRVARMEATLEAERRLRNGEGKDDRPLR